MVAQVEGYKMRRRRLAAVAVGGLSLDELC
jgi:hypothetical protein